MVLKAWDLAQKAAAEMPPYLTDDDLTIERFHEKNRDKMSREEANNLLERLVVEGKLEKQKRRRRGRSGSHVVVFVVKS